MELPAPTPRSDVPQGDSFPRRVAESLRHHRLRIAASVGRFRHRRDAAKALQRLGGLADALAHQANGARRFSEITEPEFLALTSTLGALLEQIDETALGIRNLEAGLRGESDNHALSFSYQLFKKSRDLVQASLDLADGTLARLGDFDESLLHVSGRHQAARRLVVVFRVIESGLRSELSRAGAGTQDAFGFSLQHLHDLHQRLASVVDGAFDEVETIHRRLHDRLNALRANRRSMVNDLAGSSRMIQQGLERTRAELVPARAIGADASRVIEQARVQAARVMVALQFQDIIRQKLEHIGDGFREIVRHVTMDSGDEASRGTPEARLAFIRAVAAIQSEQICESRRQIETAAGALVAGLNHVLQCVFDLQSNMRRLNQVAIDGLRQMDAGDLFAREIRRLNASGSACAVLHQEVGNLARLLETCVATFARSITGLDADVVIAVLNTQISAIHAQIGGALNQLAAETAANAREFREVGRGLTSTLGDEIPPLRDLERRTSAFLELCERDQRHLEEESREAALRLNGMANAIRADADRAESRFEGLQRQAAEALKQLRFLDGVRSEFDAAEALCRRLASLTSAADEIPAAGEFVSANLDSLKHRYTMEDERQAHRRVRERRATSPTPVPAQTDAHPEAARDIGATSEASVDSRPVSPRSGPPVAAAVSSELGDGIELF